jgi:hypothetical protein
MLDKPPAPFNTDFYAHESTDSVRGAAIRVGEVIDIHLASSHAVSKVPHRFDTDCVVPNVPADPLYVLPRSKFTVHDHCGSRVANSIIDGLRLVSPADAVINVEPSKMKVSILIPNSLDMKIKLFACDGDLLVTFRRDSGDWFVFIHIFSAIKKYLRNNCALSVESH